MEDDGRPDLARTVQICLAKQSADGQVDVDNGRAFANAVLEFTEIGLVGNRAIPSSALWNVVLAMERAFPVLMSPGVDTVRAQEGEGLSIVSKLWILQAAQDGSLAFLVSKVRTQPQVYTAYLSSAPMRSKEATEFEAAVMPLKGAVKFAELHAAAQRGKASVSSAASSNPPGTIEARDAAPVAQQPVQASPARSTGEKRTGSSAEKSLQPTSSGLNHIWEAQWSRLPVTRAERSSAHESGSSAQSESAHLRSQGADAGHIGYRMLAPSLGSAARQMGDQQRLVQVSLKAVEVNSIAGLSAGDVHVNVYLHVLQNEPSQDGAQLQSRQSRLAQHFDSVIHNQASAAALTGIQSLAGILKAPQWASRQGPGASPHTIPSKDGPSTAEVPFAEKNTAADLSQLTTPTPASAARSGAQPAVPKLVTVHLTVAEAGAHLGPSSEPCSLTLRVVDDAALQPGTPASVNAPRARLAALSGLFRSSRAGETHPPPISGVLPPQPEAGGLLVAQHAQGPEESVDTASTAPVVSSKEAAQAGDRQTAAWAVAGAIGSLYGFVSHAAESTVRLGHQGFSRDAEAAPGSEVAAAKESSRGPADARSSRSPRAAAAPSKQEEAEAAAGDEIVLRLKTAAAAVLQAGVGQGAEVLGPGDADIESVCSGVEALLRHGLRPANPREGWTQYLPGRRSTPMDMLQEAQRLAFVEEGKGWGLEGVEALAAGHSNEAALQIWIRSSLNERALGLRLQALCAAPSLLLSWYSRHAVLRQEEAAGQLLGLLLGLDAVKVLLPVEAAPAMQLTEGGPGRFLAGMTNFLPGRHSASTATSGVKSLQPPPGSSPTTPKVRKRTQAVTIDEAREEPRPSATVVAAAAERSPAASELLPPSLGTLLLSPMSSADISAEPLSPTTTASFQALRARHLAGQEGQPGDPAAEADLLALLLLRQGVLPAGAQSSDLAAGIMPGSSAQEQHSADAAAWERSDTAGESKEELAAFLDDLLATPEDSMFAPQLGAQPVQFAGDPGKDPPPWRPLKPHSRASAVAEPTSAAVELTDAATASSSSISPFQAAQPVESYNSAEERRRAAEAIERSFVKAKSRLARKRANAEGNAETKPAVAVQGRQDDISLLSPTGSMLGARSQEGDFYRLLDSNEPATHRSFHMEKDEPLPRSFSIAARGGQPEASSAAIEQPEAGDMLQERGAGMEDTSPGSTGVDSLDAGAHALPIQSGSDAPSRETAHETPVKDAQNSNDEQAATSAIEEPPAQEEHETKLHSTALAQQSDGREADRPLEEPAGAAETALAHQDPSTELSYSELTRLLSTSEGDMEPHQASSISDMEEEGTAEVTRQDSASYQNDNSTRVPAPDTEPADAPAQQTTIDDSGAAVSQQPQLSDPPHQDTSAPEEEPGGRDQHLTVEQSGASVEILPKVDTSAQHPAQASPPPANEPEGDAGDMDTQTQAKDQPPDLAHITPPSSASRTVEAGGHAVLRQSVGQQSMAPEIREFLVSQGLHDIAEAQQMETPGSLDENLADQLSPGERSSLTDANLLEDMNEILMLDLGGLGGFRTPLTSPRGAGSSRFSFDDPVHSPQPPEPEPLGPSWRVSEARVVGAATVSEGAAEFTQYSVEVTPANEGEAWTVHHRFKDFIALRAALTALAGPGNLPQCWADVSKARSVTGRHRLAPEVVAARQAMLDRCIVSVVQAGPPLSEAPPLLAFLAPADPQWEPPSQAGPPGSPSGGHRAGGDPTAASSQLATAGSGPGSSASSSAEAGSRYGSLVRLLTEEPPRLAEADLIRMQRGQCAACRAPLPTPVKQSSFLGSRSTATGPRRCDYNGRLYCHECHRGDATELPAAVLHHWDFHPRPVSTLAADYLASIADRPLLCIGAVNPGLYARVPMLARAQDLRSRACKALAAARASGPEGAEKAKRLLAGAGQRRYLLESPDFWAMRELVELSKGAFSRLPAWLEAAAARAAALATDALLTAAAAAGQPSPLQQPRPHLRGGRR